MLLENIYPEARKFAKTERKVEFEMLFKYLSLKIAEYIIDHVVHVLFIESRQVNLCHFTMDPDNGGFAGAYVQVGSTAFKSKAQQFRNIHYYLLSFQ